MNYEDIYRDLDKAGVFNDMTLERLISIFGINYLTAINAINSQLYIPNITNETYRLYPVLDQKTYPLTVKNAMLDLKDRIMYHNKSITVIQTYIGREFNIFVNTEPDNPDSDMTHYFHRFRRGYPLYETVYTLMVSDKKTALLNIESTDPIISSIAKHVLTCQFDFHSVMVAGNDSGEITQDDWMNHD